MNHFLKTKAYLFILAALLLVSEPVFAGALDFSVNPSRVRMAGPAGESKEFVITVTNKGEDALRVNIELNDMLNEIQEDGHLQRIYVPPGTVDSSLAKWITMEQDEIVVEPKMSYDLSFLVSIPEGSSGLHYSVAFFTANVVNPPEAAHDEDKAQSTVMIQPRLGCLIFYEVEGTIDRTGELKDLQYTLPDEDNPLTITYDLENTGNADVLLTGQFYILDSNNALVAKEKLQPVRTFPGDVGSSYTEWPGYLEPGKYHMVVNIELGPNATQVILKEYDFEITEEE